MEKSMDREIPAGMRRKRMFKKLLSALGIVTAVAGGSVLASRLMEERLVESALQTGIVDRGAIETTVPASGKISPLLEIVIVSPINSRVLETYKKPGDIVEAGEPLLKLELTSIETEYRQKLDEREIMKSKLIQLQVRLDNAISELIMQQQIKEMRVRQLENDLAGEIHLDSIGATTADKLRRAQLACEEAKLELGQLKQRTDNEKRSAGAELNMQQLELDIFEKSLTATARLLREARILSPQRATLTFIHSRIGAQVTEGATLATVSDLTRFKVEAELSDGHRDKLSIGSQALIEIDGLRFGGTVVNIKPSITNGIIEFTLIPDDLENPGLRSGLKADVYLLYGKKRDVLRIPNRSQFKYGRGEYFVWALKPGYAEKRKVRVGESSFEYVEILDGLSPGEKVILSADMEKYGNREIIQIK
jgi:HlyD family secretion protein